MAVGVWAQVNVYVITDNKREDVEIRGRGGVSRGQIVEDWQL
jgi:hypothetical protein